QCIDRALKLSSGERPASAFMLQQGLMGKDMAQAAKPMRQTTYRPGAGFIGVVLPAETHKKKRRRRTGVERLVALLVFVTTLLVIAPKMMIDSGHMTADDLYDWLDGAKAGTMEWL